MSAVHKTRTHIREHQNDAGDEGLVVRIGFKARDGYELGWRRTTGLIHRLIDMAVPPRSTSLIPAVIPALDRRDREDMVSAQTQIEIE